jgi:hypothetical protein
MKWSGRSAAAGIVTTMLCACGVGSVETYQAAGVEPLTLGPANPNGEAVAGMYTSSAGLGAGDQGSSPTEIQILILNSGRVYAITHDSAGKANHIYIGNGAQEKVPVVADPLANQPLTTERYSFDSSAIRDLPIPDKDRPPPLQTVLLTSLVRPMEIIYNGSLKRSGATVSFRAWYDREFNSALPSIAKIATGRTRRYAGLFVVGDIAATGHRGSLGIRVEDAGDGTANLILDNGCTGPAGKLYPHSRDNFYEVSMSYQSGGCGGEPFTGHAILENGPQNRSHVTLVAANKGFTQVLGFVGGIETVPASEVPR